VTGQRRKPRQQGLKSTPALSEDQFVDNVRQLATEIGALNHRAVFEYEPVVETLVRTRSRGKVQIEQALDSLLSFCGFAPVLELYRRLCRHYWDIDPIATASYVEAYRTMWDTDEDAR
jgi:hypothetical protein